MCTHMLQNSSGICPRVRVYSASLFEFGGAGGLVTCAKLFPDRGMHFLFGEDEGGARANNRNPPCRGPRAIIA